MTAEKVLVTGGGGYIGSVLVSRLLEENYRVSVLDNFSVSQSSLLGLCHNPNLEIIPGDARDGKTVRSALEGVDIILPLAAIVGAPACDRDRVAAKSTNLNAIKTLLKLKGKEQGVIFPCTNSGYGLGQKDIHCTEETPLNPVSYYGRLKVEAERHIMESGNAISLRLATVFGLSPAMRLDLLVNNFVYRALNDGFVVLYQAHFKRNYINIRDVAKAFLHCLKNFSRLKGESYNVGLSQANLSKLELCQAIKKRVPGFYFVEAEVGEDIDQRNYIVSNQKIEATGYRPDISLDEGIAELVKGYRIIRGTELQGNVPKGLLA